MELINKDNYKQSDLKAYVHRQRLYVELYAEPYAEEDVQERVEQACALLTSSASRFQQLTKTAHERSDLVSDLVFVGLVLFRALRICSHQLITHGDVRGHSLASHS